MAFTLAERDVRPITAEEAMRMVEAGILSGAERLELLHGVLTEKSVKGPEHEAVKNRLNEWLTLAGPAGGHCVRVEGCMAVPDGISLPEPDLAVVPRGRDPRTHPTTALLVIEVAISSLRTDTTIKPALYAAADVPELWVVDVAARRLRIFTDVQAGAYKTQRTAEAHEVVRPRHVDAPSLELAELFAGL